MSKSISISRLFRISYLTYIKALSFTFVLSLSSTGFTSAAECIYIEKQNIKKLPLEEILSYVTDVFQRNNQAGLMIGVISNQERAVISCGETTIGNGKRPEMDSIWSIGSVSKVITTQMLAILVNKGIVNLNTPVSELVGKPNREKTPITLLDLATHTSGFPRILPGFPDNEDYQILNTPYEMKDFLSWYNTFTPEWPPGTHFDYSNVAFGALGRLLAKKMNKDYASLLSELITTPLGMNDTTTHLNPEQRTRKVDSYWLNGDLIKKDWDVGFEAPSQGLYSSMRDLLIFTEYQLRRSGSALRTNQITHASYVYKNELENLLHLDKNPDLEADVKFTAIGLGWMVNFPTDTFPLQLDKDGCVNGVYSLVLITPTENIGVVSLTNSLQSLPFKTMHADLQNIIRHIIRAQ